MRILLINRNDFVDGGADRVFLNTVELLQVPSFEFQVEEFTRKDVGLDNSENLRNLSFWKKARSIRDYLYNPKVARKLEDKILEFKPDLAHIHLIFGTLSLSVLRVLKKHKVPIVMTVHDYRLICPVNAMLDRNGKVCEQCQGEKYYKCLTRRCSEGNIFYSAMAMMEAYLRKYFIKPLKLVDHFIFVSQFARNKHIEFIPQYQEKSSHLYNMTEENAKPEMKRGDYLLYFGRLSKEKGIKTLLESIEALNERHGVLNQVQDDNAGLAKILIAGSGPLEKYIQEITSNQSKRSEDPDLSGQPATSNQQPVTCNIEFVGFKNNSELKNLIRNSSFVVVPSEWYENNPMTIVEAFSLGKPVIGANIGGIPELVNEFTGFLFDSGDPKSLQETILKTIKLKTKDYIQMSNRCWEFANKHFDRDNHLLQLQDIYSKLVS